MPKPKADLQKTSSSLQLRLAVRLAVLYVIGTGLAVAVLLFQAYTTAGSLNDRELSLRAEDLARAVIKDSSGKIHLNLPAQLAAAYAASPDVGMYAVRDTAGQVVAASPSGFGDKVSKWPAATDDANYFRLSDYESKNYNGLSIELPTAAGPMWISVARADGSGALIESILREFALDVIWVSPLFMIATLGISVLAIRNGLKPVRQISQMASSIGPNAMSVRLPEKNLPTEITPLVVSVNQALDRVEKGFAVQREFTANAAHELRTPLAIITSALDAMNGNGEIAKLRIDVTRMNRLVDQLLRVARLDAIGLELSIVDLNKVASSVVAAMAPWAIAQHKETVFVASEQPVEIKANADALEDALRNLVENAVVHTPIGTEVVVRVSPNRRIDVADRGMGVPPADRENIFKRFWRAPGEKKEGAGLGLAIVSEIMKAHGGFIRVLHNPGGGALFSLSFPALRGESFQTVGSLTGAKI